LIPWVDEPVMLAPEVAVLMSMAGTVAAARDRRFSIRDRSGQAAKAVRNRSGIGTFVSALASTKT
jgi:hypothetical protein